MDLSIIIVNYNTGHLLGKCLSSLYRDEDKSLQFEIFVVDNGSKDGTLSEIEKEYPRVNYIKNRENLGFSRANNQAIARAKGKNILLLNSDTEVLPGSLGKMVKFSTSHPEIGVIGSKLLNRDGSLQYSFGKFPTTFATALRLFLPPSKRKYVLHGYGKAHPVDWVSGASFMVKKEVIEKVGPLDEDYFMYYEETDWCYRIKGAGWEVFYFPGARVIHDSGNKKRERKILREIRRSHLLFYKKNYSKKKFSILKKLVWWFFKLKIVGLNLLRLVTEKKEENLSLCKEILKDIGGI
jgi:GT2 family glycosyltransferase